LLSVHNRQFLPFCHLQVRKRGKRSKRRVCPGQMPINRRRPDTYLQRSKLKKDTTNTSAAAQNIHFTLKNLSKQTPSALRARMGASKCSASSAFKERANRKMCKVLVRSPAAERQPAQVNGHAYLLLRTAQSSSASALSSSIVSPSSRARLIRSS
jgi:hypothetical protein